MKAGLRLLTCLHNWFVALDQLAFVTFAAPKYILFGGTPPSPQETISSRVGRMAIKGRRWALICEVLINALFLCLGEANHCRNAIVTEDDWKDYRA